MFFQAIRNLFRQSKEKTPWNTQLFSILGFYPSIQSIHIYKRAFTHPMKGKNTSNFERLEFLGDAVLTIVVSEYLYDFFTDKNEGYLTQMRSKLVNREYLNSIGKSMNLTQLLDKHEDHLLGKDIHGDLLEALIGAIYKDKGFEASTAFILKHIIEPLEINQLEKKIDSYKKWLYEWCQSQRKQIEFNTFEEENNEDVIIFCSVLRIDDRIISKGRGEKKKLAEENAAKRAYYIFNKGKST